MVGDFINGQLIGYQGQAQNYKDRKSSKIISQTIDAWHISATHVSAPERLTVEVNTKKCGVQTETSFGSEAGVTEIRQA